MRRALSSKQIVSSAEPSASLESRPRAIPPGSSRTGSHPLRGQPDPTRLQQWNRAGIIGPTPFPPSAGYEEHAGSNIRSPSVGSKLWPRFPAQRRNLRVRVGLACAQSTWRIAERYPRIGLSIVSSDPFYPSVIVRFAVRPPGARMDRRYGPSESRAGKTRAPLSDRPASPQWLLPARPRHQSGSPAHGTD